MESNRRSFIKKTATGAAAISIGRILPGFSAKSYGNISGANERIKVAMMGVNSRGAALAKNFARQTNCEIMYVCDVDSRAAATCIDNVEKLQKKRPKDMPDFRKALADKDVDALVIAAPDHWHAPAAIMASAAGKHVYVEKPCSHNPHEGEMLVAANTKYKNVIQMGNQRRSWPNVIAGIAELHAGVIGRPYFAKTWYTNNRLSIGKGKQVTVPSWLNYDLWQGPAPRRPYQDNMLHYNWHWFWNWGTGEACNNGIHSVDLARLGLGVDYPSRVSAAGGRYRYQDDWQTPDTHVITIEFKNNACIAWEGRSCNGRSVEGAGVGVIFYGEKGSLMIGNNDYSIYDLNNKLVKEVKDNKVVDTQNLVSPLDELDALHIRNFFDGISKGTNLYSPILGGFQSTLLCQLGNIALRSGKTLNIDPTNGHIVNDAAANKFWKREYQPGWEPKV
ncbi:MAG: Gfo/Idh/MocA family oxidoreductase [Chitinophagaceae bacterium]